MGEYREWIRSYYRSELGINEEYVVLAVGQFIPRKGFDVLLKAAREFDRKVGIYIVGGNPTDECLRCKSDYHLDNVHFCGYKPKSELKKYYLAADVFVHSTREDIWGLVINEARACGLPVVVSDHCVAGLELVKQGCNGYVVPLDQYDELLQNVLKILKNEELYEAMANNCLTTIRPYTIENMAYTQIDAFREILLKNVKHTD